MSPASPFPMRGNSGCQRLPAVVPAKRQGNEGRELHHVVLNAAHPTPWVLRTQAVCLDVCPEVEEAVGCRMNTRSICTVPAARS